jgi:hypothetical protein
MTNENKQVILDLARKLIKDLTNDLNNKLEELTIHTNQADKDSILIECDSIMTEINGRLNQFTRTDKD